MKQSKWLGFVLTLAAILLIGQATLGASSPPVVVHHSSGEDHWVLQMPLGLVDSGEVWVTAFYPGNPGDIIRTGPDESSVFLHTESNDALIFIAILTEAGEVIEWYAGPGHVRSTYTAKIYVAPDGKLWYQGDGKREEFSITGNFYPVEPWSYTNPTPLSDERFPFVYQKIVRDNVDVLKKLVFEPYGADVQDHK